MKEKNRIAQPFLMVIVLIGALFVLSLVNTQFKIERFQSKEITLFSEVLKKGAVKKVPLPNHVLNDSIKAKEIAAYTLRKIDSSNIVDFEMDSVTALTHFFQSLNSLKKKKSKIRIAYFGDSMIEGDLISQDLRENMQNIFGGEGVGFVPVTSLVSGFRKSITHSFDGWKVYNLLEDIPLNHDLGISGYCFVPKTSPVIDTLNATSGSWVKYKATNKKHLNQFHKTKLLYGQGDDGNYVIINNNCYRLTGKNLVNELSVQVSDEELHARFQCKKPIDIYGFSMESDTGIFVDNFSFRGNSGLANQKVKQNMYAATHSCLEYDLIILEYGVNAVSPDASDFSWYENSMNQVIRYMKSSFPKTSVLLVSVGDKGSRKDGVYQTDPGIPILVETQRRMAQENKTAFWSLYDAMGGYGSMVKWVEEEQPSLANKDYTHFNFQGAHKVGKLLFDKLMSEYKDYNKKQRQGF